MRIGRNSPCRCGSGRKYKKCCRNADLIRGGGASWADGAGFRYGLSAPGEWQHAIGASAGAQDRIARLMAGADERKRRMREAVRVVSACSRNRPEWASSEQEAARVKVTLHEIGVYCRVLLAAGKHSRQYWYQLLRRGAPILLEELRALAPEVEVTPSWYGEVVKGASHLVLQCTGAGDPWEWVDDGNVRGIDYRNLSLEDLEVAAQVISLAQLQYEARVRYRFACKKFRVFGAPNEGDVLAAQDLRSVTGYEVRRDRFDSLAGAAGLWCDPASVGRVRPDLCHWFGVHTALPGHFRIHSRDPVAEIGAQFLLTPYYELRDWRAGGTDPANLSFVPYDCLISHPNLAPAFEAAFDVGHAELIAFLYAVHRMVYSVLRFPRLDFGQTAPTLELHWEDEPSELRAKTLHYWSDVAELGLLRSSRADWIAKLVREAEVVREFDPSVSRLNQEAMAWFVDRFTWTDNDPLYGNRPYLFTALSTHTLVLDGFSAADFLLHVLLQVNLVGRDKAKGGQIGDVTGPWLERQAACYLARNLGLPMESLLCGKRIGKSAEIDVAFVYRRVLFVIDCKALAKDAGFMEGDYNRLRNRASEILSQLTEKIPRRVRLICEGKAQPVISPTAFDRAVGLVCTSAVEYLPLEVSEYWSSDIPLVGPPEELLESIKILSK